MDSTSAVEKILVFVKPQYEALECWIHRWPHIHDVMENAKKLAELENADIDACVIAALCHDLGRIEEETRKLKGQSPLPHALLSIEPTIKILQQVGISGVKFNEIIEAVAVHSYKDYAGNNTVAKILRDADKMGSGFGPYRLLNIIRYFGGRDYVNPEEIINNKDNPEKLQELCEASLSQMESLVLKKVKEGIDFILEWFGMFHTKSAQNILAGEDKYLRVVKNSLA
jgi:hypothetical protein